MILGALSLLGAFFGIFLPETLHQKLPDSMTEARNFGADQVLLNFCLFFSLLKLKKKL